LILRQTTGRSREVLPMIPRHTKEFSCCRFRHHAVYPHVSLVDYVTVIFGHLVEPIFQLYQQLIAGDCNKPNQVQTSSIENGYAISVVTLSALLIESVCGRACFVKRVSRRMSAAAVVRSFGDTNLAADVEEIFVARDAAAHGHLWVAEVAWKGGDLVFVRRPRKLPPYGDAKFRRVVDMKTRTTRRLGLDVFPTRINRHTAVVALKQAVRVLRFFEGLDRAIAYLSPEHVFVNGKATLFFKWVDSLKH
jgi:hypothetical protein